MTESSRSNAGRQPFFSEYSENPALFGNASRAAHRAKRGVSLVPFIADRL